MNRVRPPHGRNPRGLSYGQKITLGVGAVFIVAMIGSAVEDEGTDTAAVSAATSTSPAPPPPPTPTFAPTPAAAAPALAAPVDSDDQDLARPGVQRMVARVVDGDTLALVDGDDVRVLGIDSCEAGTPGGTAATAAAEDLIGTTVTLLAEPGAPDRDFYGRLLRYVALPDGRDFGVSMVPATHTGVYQGSNDASSGYVALLEGADGAARDCDGPDPTPTPEEDVDVPDPNPDVDRPRPAATGGGSGGGCAPGYSPCVPAYPPDLDCGDLGGPYAVTGSDPHGLDGNGDGEGCE
ncbi:MAG: hypothetical protein L0I76_37485 [Pseudonocardia sp.]|nr:hypothetical protein [Pseudonocardia sp.]